MKLLPQYQCHKKVWALKIKAIEKLHPTIAELEAILNEGKETPTTGGMITPENPDFPPFPVTTDFMHRHDPQPGGYWVKYEDGYESFSPAPAFESGYTLIT